MQPGYEYRIHELLEEMDNLFIHFFEWLEGQYDPVTGGFYYARSSKESAQFSPDIESTAQALNILERCGLLHSWGEQRIRKAVQFFQSKQQGDSGYFYDGHPEMRMDEVMVGRAIGYSLHALRKLGAAPLFPLPEQHGSMPEHMNSPQSYKSWLESVELGNSWRGCDRLSVTAAYLSAMDESTRQPYVSEAFRFFEEIQDGSTGLWGGGSRYVKLSGTFKLHLFYDRFRVALPRETQIFQSIKQTLAEDIAEDMCYIRNPIHLLSYMKIPMSNRELYEIILATYTNMRELLRLDGGFSRELHRSPPAPNVAQVKAGEHYPNMPKPVPLGAGKVEGDMNAGTQAVLIRSLCNVLAGVQKAPLQPAGRTKESTSAESHEGKG